MAKKTVRVDIPSKSPDAMLDLGKKIVKKHKADGAASPLTGGDVDMALFEANVLKADTFRADAADLYAAAEKKMQEARKVLGIDVGQSINTLGTTYSDMDLIKGRLLNKNKGTEEALSLYGFNVVISTAKAPTKKTK
jgi:hypothetical protein